MGLNPFGTVSDYPSMLNKIAMSTLLISIGAVSLLSWQIQAVHAALKTFSFVIHVWEVSVPIGILIPAFLMAAISRIFKLHDRLAFLFGIRRRFDINEILMPLALGSASASFSIEQMKKIRSNRSELMGDVFYKYASSSPGKAQIEQHYIIMALDQWSWYWILLEATFVIVITSLILLFAGKSTLAAILLLISLLVLWLTQGVRSACARYALQEVDQILDDNTRKRNIALVFHAL